jgi:SAM-dependent methyltransferase
MGSSKLTNPWHNKLLQQAVSNDQRRRDDLTLARLDSSTLGDYIGALVRARAKNNAFRGMTHRNDRDTVGRFRDRAADYVRYRPTYPAEAVHAILGGLGPPGRLIAADVGAGTGISARLIGEQGVRVIAVEPGEAMRRAAAPHPNVAWVAAQAEATGLCSQTVDLVLCAQSFHWFRTADALSEFARILKERGHLAISWNRRSTSDPLTAGYRQAIVDVGGEITAESRTFDPNVIGASGLFSSPERKSFPNFQRLDLAGLIGRARSASYVPRNGAAGERLLGLLRALHERHADGSGFVTLVYDTEVFCSTRL